jgi:hypothetical protein
MSGCEGISHLTRLKKIDDGLEARRSRTDRDRAGERERERGMVS